MQSRCSSFSYKGPRNHVDVKRQAQMSDKHEIIWAESTERRTFLHLLSFVSAATTSFNTNHAHAAAVVSSSNSSSTGVMTQQQKVKALLHSVPVFTIVDPKGVPFMVVGEDAKISCYFFTTYSEADRLLSLARNSVDQSMKEKYIKKEANREDNKDDDEPYANPWKEAQISSVPLDFAVELAKRGKLGGAYFFVAPADVDVQDALALNPDVQELSEGKVPLFYIEDFTIVDNMESALSTTKKQSPLYFCKKDLLKEWRKFHPKEIKDDPPIKVTELFAVLKILLSSTDVDDDIQSIIFVPPTDSIQKARECKARMGKNEAFQLGKRILVL